MMGSTLTLAEHQSDGGVLFGGSAWLIRARVEARTA